MSQLPSGLVTFCFTDIEGSTKLFAKLGPSFMDLLDQHRRIIREAIESRGGVEVKTEGDGFFIAFDDPARALTAVVDFQRRLATYDWPAGAAIRVRVGLHSGAAEPTENDYLAFAVHEAARIGAAANGGQTIVSDEIARSVRSSLPDGTTLLDLGLHELKDLDPMRLHQVCHPDLDADFPPLRSISEDRGYVPATTSSLVGRDGDLDDLLDRLRSTRLLTITGSGGVGKTRLAVETARRELGNRADGVWFVDLAKLTDASWLDEAVLDAIGAVRDSALDAGAQLLSTLRSRDTLLVIDNCEHLVAAASELIGNILAGCDRVVVLATSREPLGVPGEIVWRARSLDADESIELFIDRASAASAGSVASGVDQDAVRRIVERLDGIPLAIELAAARSTVLTPTQIADRLDDRFRLLTGGSRTALPRQRTLEAAVDWSYQLLDDDERTLLRRLTVFVGGFDLDAAEHLWNGDVLDVLGRLVDKSMVVASLHGDGVRYRLLETIRAYGWMKLVDAGEATGARDAHAEHFAVIAEALGDHMADAREVEVAAQIGLEHENIRSALEWSIDAMPETAARIAANIWLYWSIVGRAGEGLSWLERTMAVSADLDPNSVAKMHAGAAHLSSVLERPSEEIQEHAQVAVDIARSRTERFWYDAWALFMLAFTLTEDLASDVALVTEALEWAIAAESDVVAAQLLISLAWHAGDELRFADARATFEKAEAIARRSGAASCIGRTLQETAEFHIRQNELKRAEAIALEAIAAAQRGPNVYFLSFALETLADVRLNTRGADAATAIARFLALSRESGLDYQIVDGLLASIGLDLAANRLDVARAQLAEARRIMSAAPSSRQMLLLAGQVEIARGELAHREGNLDKARRIFQANLDLASSFGVGAAMAYCRLALGWLERDGKDLDAARTQFITAITDVASDVNHNWALRVAAASIKGLAGVAHAEGDPRVAARLLGRASEYVAYNANAPRLASTLCLEMEDEVREILGPQAFEEAFAEGRAVGLDDFLSGARRA